MELKGQQRPPQDIDDIIYKRNGIWYNAFTDRYTTVETATRLRSYYTQLTRIQKGD